MSRSHSKKLSYKWVLVSWACLCLVLLSHILAIASPVYRDGAYRSTGDGLFGEIEVEVLIDGGQITDIVVVNHQETPTIAQAAFRKVIAQVVEEQTCENVDTVTGATGTSKGVIEAIANALAQASAQE